MKIKQVYKTQHIQFEVIEDSIDYPTIYRRDWYCDVWEQLCGESWESLYEYDNLEEMYQKYKLTDEYKKIY
jgi:hypothetical protein